VKALRRESGYTVVEMLIVMVVMGIVIGGITTAFVSGSKAELDMNRRFSAQLSVRLAMTQLRADVHLACSATASAGQLLLYPSAGSSSAASCAASPTIAWCTGASSTATGRYTLFEASAASCSNPPGGKPWADYLTTNSIFTVNTPAAGSKQLMSVTVALAANTNKSLSATTGVDRYLLADTIVMRNSVPG